MPAPAEAYILRHMDVKKYKEKIFTETHRQARRKMQSLLPAAFLFFRQGIPV